MSQKLLPRTPVRRSTRGQPIVITGKSGISTESSAVTWPSPPVHTRATNPQLDFMGPDDVEAWDNLEEEEQDRSQTKFYAEFQKPPAKKAFRRASGGKAQKSNSSEVETYRIGDTVLVSTMTLSPHKLPSVAVIVAMWELDFGPENERKRVCLHWFTRPNELAAIRAKRAHLKVSPPHLL